MTTPQRRRIAYLVSKYPDFSHTFILREVLALRGSGIEIDIASINQGPPSQKLTQIERNESASTFYVKQSGLMGVVRAKLWLLMNHPAGLVRGGIFALKLAGGNLPQALRCLFYFAEAMILAKWMHERSVTHLHVHFATPAATVAMILTQIAPVTLSITVHGPDEFYDVSSYYLAQKIEASKFIVCISFFAQSQLMKLAPGSQWSKFSVARLGVDTSQFLPQAQRALPQRFQILCVGRLVPAKGQRILIEAIAQLVHAGHPVCLELVGDGPDRRELEAMVRARRLHEFVNFAGAVNQDQIKDFYRQADIFALASFAEGIPVVLMEAMAMEIPCVATRIAGIPELIENGVSGLLVSPSDIVGMADAIARLMASPELRQSLGAAGRLRVQQEYELSRNTAQLSTIFAERLGWPK